MKRLLGTLLAAALSFGAQAELIKDEDPHVLLEKVANKTFERIGEDRDKIEENLDYLRVIVEEEMLPYVDYQFAANKTLGRNFKDTPPELRREYQQVFRDYLVATYARAFLQYDEDIHSVEFEPARGFDEKSTSTVVRTRVVEQGRPPIRLDFRMRKSSNDGIWRAYDLVVEGISLLSSKEAEISSVIRSNGIEGTIKLLREKAEQEIRSDDEVEVPES